MKFSTRHDIEAPIDFVFVCATDFAGFERQALRRGIDIGRSDAARGVAAGMRWKAKFAYRGKTRKLAGELTRLDAPHSFLIQSVSGGVESDLDVEFMALSRLRTRVRVALELSPKTLSARLLVQSLKFSKKSLDTRFAKRVGQFSQDIETQFGQRQRAL
ncbi:MAG: SRPBCC family protein [Paracoccaceae bacterium]